MCQDVVTRWPMVVTRTWYQCQMSSSVQYPPLVTDDGRMTSGLREHQHVDSGSVSIQRTEASIAIARINSFVKNSREIAPEPEMVSDIPCCFSDHRTEAITSVVNYPPCLGNVTS